MVWGRIKTGPQLEEDAWLRSADVAEMREHAALERSIHEGDDEASAPAPRPAPRAGFWDRPVAWVTRRRGRG